MKARAGRILAAVAAAALMTTSLVAVSPPSAGAACVVPASGRWTGTATGVSSVYAIDAEETFHADGTITGSVLISGAGPYSLTGSYDCAGNISLGVVTAISTFSGTIGGSGRTQSGSFTAAGDSGTWETVADPYALTATSIVQPTTIAAGAASSWVIEVDNSTATAAATAVEARFVLSGAGKFGPVSQTSVSQGTGCFPDIEFPNTVMRCNLGVLLPTDRKASATVVVNSTGGAGSSIVASGFAVSTVGGGVDDSAPPVTISVVGPASLPNGQASGVAQPGVKFETVGGKQATPTNPIKVIFKLPKKVALGSTGLALSKAAQQGLKKRAIDGVSLMSATKGAAGKAPTGSALGRPWALTVKGPAVPMSISRTAAEAGTFCGGAACSGDIVHLTNFSGYNDRKRPAKVTITWDKTSAGRGLGSAIFKRADATTATTWTLSACVKTKVGYTNTPCISKRKLVAKGDVQFTLLVLSGDPKFGRR